MLEAHELPFAPARKPEQATQASSRRQALIQLSSVGAAIKEAMTKQGNILNISTPEFARPHFESKMLKSEVLAKRADVVRGAA